MVEMDKIVSLCKRRGFIFQSSEIYGGTGSCWDYGPLGVELKNNVKRVWWRDSVQNRADMVGLDVINHVAENMAAMGVSQFQQRPQIIGKLVKLTPHSLGGLRRWQQARVIAQIHQTARKASHALMGSHLREPSRFIAATIAAQCAIDE